MFIFKRAKTRTNEVWNTPLNTHGSLETMIAAASKVKPVLKSTDA